MASSSSSAVVEREQQQQQPPLRDHDGAAAPVLPPKLWFHTGSTNYLTWRDQVLDFFRGKGEDAIGLIDGSLPPPSKTFVDPMMTTVINPAYATWKIYDMYVKEWILVFLQDKLVPGFAALDTARDVWLALENVFNKYQLQSGAAPPPMDEGLAGQAIRDVNILQRAALQGKWETARTILDMLPPLGVDLATDQQVCSIHIRIAFISIGGGKRTADFCTKLVTYLPYKSLGWLDFSTGLSALHFAAYAGNNAAAILLVERVPDLLYVADNRRNLPVHIAANFSQRETLQYLMAVTSWDVTRSPYADARGQLKLFIHVADAEFFDIALDLVDKHPQIATTKIANNITALHHMAAMVSKFSSRGRFNNLWECFLCTFPQIMSIDGKYFKRRQILELVKRLCKALESLRLEEAYEIYTDAIITAAGFGSHEVIEEIGETCPMATLFLDPNTRCSIFHLAIKHRYENVFNLIYRVGGYRPTLSELQDQEGNNMLHLAAKLAPAHRLNQISGPALQMQREIQWYKEVEKVVAPSYRRAENNYQKTPAMVFTEEHNKLKDGGEKWMKDTANSCSIVAALIITIMFAAAITVPGGNESNSGFPVFRGDYAFIVFGIADAVSLFMSATSLLIFLSILTSRFPEESFLYYHPTQLIFGLGTLFLSIASMMVAFTATTFLVLGKKEAWMLIPTIALASLGVASFAFLQFPLLCVLISSTYGPGIFKKKKGKPLL